MSADKYVAYVSTYTSGDKHGIKIYDVDMEKGRFTYKNEILITNSSYLTMSHDFKFLYAITDLGVASYIILPDGNLELLNGASINGMRGCYLSTDYEDRFLFVSGYHDGKLTVLRVNEDGSVGAITDEVYHKGMGSIAERNFRPHIQCSRMTKDNKYLCVTDLGMDHIKIYKPDFRNGRVKLVDIVRSEPESAPRHIKFSKDGRYAYVVHELKNYIDVYEYHDDNGTPYFDKIQNIATLNDYHSGISAASALNFSEDYEYVVSSNAGDNSVIIYKASVESGLLKKILCLPINGSYPKDAKLFPDNRHLVSLNHESDTLTFFKVDMEKGTLIMNGPEIRCEKPNTVIFRKVDPS